MLDLHLQAHWCRRPGPVRELQHGKLLGELVEDPALARRGGVQARDLDALHRIANIEKAARLSALAVDGQRMPIAACAQKRFSTVPNTSS